MRKQYSKQFKFKVALAALRGDKTIAQLVSEYQVAESLIHKWKKTVLDNGSRVFETGSAVVSPPPTEDIPRLQAKIGALTVERDFLEQALGVSAKQRVNK
jgi:transposase-like protein